MNAKRRNMAIYAGKLMSAVLLCYLLSLWVSRLDYIDVYKRQPPCRCECKLLLVSRN